MRWFRQFIVALLLCGPAAAAAQEGDATDLADRLIRKKLTDDRAYFAWRLQQHESGERPADLTPQQLADEVRRARSVMPLLDGMLDAAAARSEGDRVPTHPLRGSPTYLQLATYLNLIGAIRAGDFANARALAGRIDLEVGFGPTQSIEDYRDQLIRHYYYLRGIAHYHMMEDEDAVQWFGQLQADAEIRDMALRRKKEVDNQRLAGLAERAIAVATFTSVDPDADADAWIGHAVADAATTDLVQLTQLQVVERERLDALMDEASLTLMGLVEEQNAMQIGRLADAGTLMLGSYQLDGDVLVLNGRLVHVETGTVLHAETVRGDRRAIFDTVRELSLALLGGAGLFSGEDKRRLRGGRTPQAGAVRAVAEARLRAATDPEAARALYEEAMRADPAYANAHEALKVAYSDVSAALAILPLRNVSGEPEDEWLGDGLAELLSKDLPALGFRTVDRSDLREAMTYQLAMMGVDDGSVAPLQTDAAQLAELGQRISANFLLVGSFQRLSPDLKLTVRFLDVGTGEVLYAAGAEGAFARYGDVVTDLVASLGQTVNRQLDDDELDRLRDDKPSLAEFESYMRAQLARDALTAETQRDQLRSDREAQLQAELQQRIDRADARAARIRWASAGGVVAGLGLASTGLALGALDRRTSGEHKALATYALRDEDRQANHELSVTYHRRANAWQVVGGVGVGVAMASTAIGVLAGRAKVDVRGLELSALPQPGGVTTSVAYRW